MKYTVWFNAVCVAVRAVQMNTMVRTPVRYGSPPFASIPPISFWFVMISPPGRHLDLTQSLTVSYIYMRLTDSESGKKVQHSSIVVMCCVSTPFHLFGYGSRVVCVFSTHAQHHDNTATHPPHTNGSFLDNTRIMFTPCRCSDRS